MHQKRPFRAHKGDDGFNRGSAGTRKGDRGFRQPAQLADRAWLRHPWAAAGPGRATSGRPTLQTSSNQRNSNRLTRTPVTNVVNLSPKTSIFNEKANGLTTFVTTGQKSTRKTPWIDDVCNNTRRATRQHTTPHWCGGRRRDLPRCPWTVAGPGRGAGGRWRGQGGPRDRPLRAVRLACGDLAGGPPPTGTHSGQTHQGRPRGGRRSVGGNKQHEAARPHRGPGGSRIRPLGGSQRLFQRICVPAAPRRWQASTTRAAMPASADLPHVRGSYCFLMPTSPSILRTPS